MIKQQEGVVSIFLNVYFDQDNTLFGAYDESACVGLEGVSRQSIADYLSKYPHADSFAAQAARAASLRGIDDATYIWVLYDHAYKGRRGPVDGHGHVGVHARADSFFLGTFDYSKD